MFPFDVIWKNLADDGHDCTTQARAFQQSILEATNFKSIRAPWERTTLGAGHLSTSPFDHCQSVQRFRGLAFAGQRRAN